MPEEVKINKITDTFSLFPHSRSWVESKAIELTIKEGRRVSKSAVIERLIQEAIQEDLRMAEKVIKKFIKKNGAKS